MSYAMREQVTVMIRTFCNRLSHAITKSFVFRKERHGAEKAILLDRYAP